MSVQINDSTWCFDFYHTIKCKCGLFVFYKSWFCMIMQNVLGMNFCNSFECSEAYAKNQMVFFFTLAVLSTALWKCIRWAQWDVWGERLRFKTWGKIQAPFSIQLKWKGINCRRSAAEGGLLCFCYVQLLLWWCGRNDGNGEKERLGGVWVCQDSWSETNPRPQGFV